MRKNIDKVAWAGGSAGGAEQILAGLIAKDLGEKPSDVNYIAHSGGGEAIATLLSRKDTAGVSSVSEFLRRSSQASCARSPSPAPSRSTAARTSRR